MDEFLATPNYEKLCTFKKSILIDIAKRLGLEQVKVSLRKSEMVRVIAQHYIDDDVFDTEVLEPQGNSGMSEVEMRLRALELKRNNCLCKLRKMRRIESWKDKDLRIKRNKER